MRDKAWCEPNVLDQILLVVLAAMGKTVQKLSCPLWVAQVEDLVPSWDFLGDLNRGWHIIVAQLTLVEFPVFVVNCGIQFCVLITVIGASHVHEEHIEARLRQRVLKWLGFQELLISNPLDCINGQTMSNEDGWLVYHKGPILDCAC